MPSSFRNCAFLALLSLGSAIAMTAPAKAATYTVTGTMTGTLDGTSFTDANVTLTTVDPSHTIQTEIVSGSLLYYDLGTTTISVDGVGTDTFTTDNYGVIAGDVSASIPGAGLFAIADITTGSGMLGGFYPEPPYLDLTQSLTVTGMGGGANQLYPTLGGGLVVTAVSGNTTFTADVPEPASLGLLLTGVVGLLARRRTR